MISRQVWGKFVALYKDRYGRQSMGNETEAMWYDCLKGLQEEPFREAGRILLGKREFKFGWKELYDLAWDKTRKPIPNWKEMP